MTAQTSRTILDLFGEAMITKMYEDVESPRTNTTQPKSSHLYLWIVWTLR